MEVIKNTNNCELSLYNEKNDNFIIHYAGGDLYWTMFNYYEDNEFIISKENEVLFSLVDEIFYDIEEYNMNLFVGNCFEWISESYGMYDDANKLIIEKDEDKFKIKFYQNPNKYGFRKDICSICFCLSGSKYQDIANMFSLMLYKYFELDKVKVKRKSN